MPRDTRLWMTFPIDFWHHPKIAPLSDAAFRTFVEMNGYSRMQDLDGRIPVSTARRLWRPKALSELTRNHHSKPSVSILDDHYVIWNYAEHQETRESREARIARNKANGAKGGRPPKKPAETQSVTDSVSEPKPSEKQSQSQSQELEKSLDDSTHLPQSSPLGDGPGEGLDLGEIMAQKAKRLGVQNFGKVLTQLRGVVGPLAPSGALELVSEITGRARNEVKNVDAYVATACRKSPEEVLADYDRLDLAALA